MGEAIACDDGLVKKLGTGWTVAACVLWDRDRGPQRIAHLPIHVDGLDATSQLLFIVRHLASHASSLDAVFFDSVTIGGFNIVSIPSIYRGVTAPVIVVYKRRPRWDRIRRALYEHFPDYEIRLRVVSIVRSASAVHTREGILYVVAWGADMESARRLIERYQMGSRVPEPLRFAHLYASALSRLLIHY
ncbi:MAG: DUF99 family protein [Desulfurococcales archaeon]|nr:DUF99 family protein [Desulfurococcales archaeon]